MVHELSEHSRPMGQTAWAEPFTSRSMVNLGSSVVAPVTLDELAELTDRDSADMLPRSLSFDYAPPGGSLPVREAVATLEFPDFVPENISITNGAGDGLAMVAELTCRPDSHVIIEVPVHESVLATARRRGCAVTLIQAPVTLDDIAEAIHPNTAAVFLSSPHNPTGQVLTEGFLRHAARELEPGGGLLVVDEVYRGVGLGVGEVPPPVASIAQNGVSVGSLSKVYGLPGLRLGWVAGPTLLVDDVRSLQRWTTRSPANSTQAIGVFALESRGRLLGRARSLIYDGFAELAAICESIPGIALPVPDGGTTAWAEVSVADVDLWCEQLAEDHGLLLAPGHACFGIPGHVRIGLGLRADARLAGYLLLDKALSQSLRVKV